MSLPRHLLAVTLILIPAVGCDVEDADDREVPGTPAPVEPAPPNRPVPQPQVSSGGQAQRVIAASNSATAAGPAFASAVG